MAKIGIVQNGVTRKKSTKSKRKNPSVTKAQVSAYAKKNGLKLTKNPAKKYVARKRNGILGNTKNDVKTVGAVLGGAVGTKAVGRVVQSLIAPYVAQVGLGDYAEIIADALIALTATPIIAKKLGGAKSANDARLGGLLTVGLDVIEMIAPDVLRYNPFTSSTPLVISGSGEVALTPDTVTKIVAGTDASDGVKAKVAGAMKQVKSGNVSMKPAQSSFAYPMFN